MKTQISKLAQMVALGLALAFTLSCSSGDDGGGGNEQKCAGVGYDPNVYRCESGELVGKCKGEDYYPAYQQCVGGVVVDGVPSSSSRGGGSSSSVTGGSSSPSGNGPKGAISMKTETEVWYRSDGTSSTYTRVTKYEYDSKGNMTKRIHYNSDGSTGDIIEYEYDNKGNQIKQIEYDSDGTYITKYEYDSKGNIIKEIRYRNENINATYEIEYDSKGNQIKVKGYDDTGALRRIYEYEYDSNSNPIREVRYTDGNLDRRYEYIWNGNTATRTLYYGDGSISYTAEITYITINSKKLETSYIRTDYKDDGSITKEKTESQYDSKGNSTKETEYKWDEDTQSWRKTEEYTYVYTFIT